MLVEFAIWISLTLQQSASFPWQQQSKKITKQKQKQLLFDKDFIFLFFLFLRFVPGCWALGGWRAKGEQKLFLVCKFCPNLPMTLFRKIQFFYVHMQAEESSSSLFQNLFIYFGLFSFLFWNVFCKVWAGRLISLTMPAKWQTAVKLKAVAGARFGVKRQTDTPPLGSKTKRGGGGIHEKLRLCLTAGFWVLMASP